MESKDVERFIEMIIVVVCLWIMGRILGWW